MRSVDPFHSYLGRDLSHLSQWLSHRGESGILEGSALNVVESHYGNVVRHANARIAKRSYCSNGGNVIKRKQRAEMNSRRKQFARDVITQDRRRGFSLKLHYQGLVDLQVQPLRRRLDRFPADFRVRTERLAFDISNLAMAQIIQML